MKKRVDEIKVEETREGLRRERKSEEIGKCELKYKLKNIRDMIDNENLSGRITKDITFNIILLPVSYVTFLFPLF